MTSASQADINTKSNSNSNSNSNNSNSNNIINSTSAATNAVVGAGVGNGGDLDATSATAAATTTIVTATVTATAATTNVANRNLNSHNNSNNASNANGFYNNSWSNMSSNTNGNQRAGVSETGKRKKLKSRNATVPAVGGVGCGVGGGSSSSGYVKDNLDAWLETCLKDASNTQLSSSSEFLDYNPMPTVTATSAATAALNAKKYAQQHLNATTNNAAQQQQQQQQRQHQQQQQQQQQTTYLSNSSSNMQQQQQQQQQFPYSTQQQQQPQPQQQQQHAAQQQFALRTNFSGPLPFANSGVYGPAPFSQGFQRSVPNFMKYMNSYNNRYSMMFPASGGMGPGPSGYYQQSDGQEFASLPPIVNMMGGGSSELENNSTDVLDGSGSNPNISRGFRFSDPCLLNPSDNDSKVSGQNTPDRRNNIPSELENNKFFTALMEQISLLHETNTKICRNLHETKVDIEALKHAPTWGMRHRRDSLSGLSTHSQPMVFGGGFGGMQSPAPTYHSGAYTPGMMTDVVREVKEAARVREDALLNRVKAMVEERQWSFNECNARLMRDIEELKSQVHHLRADRKESSRRLTHLEAENKYMRQMLTSIFNQRHTPDIIYENETLRPQRKVFNNSRRTQSLNLHYGTIHHQPPPAALTVDEQDERLQIVETPSTASTAELAAVLSGGGGGGGVANELRNSFSSTDSGGNAVGAGVVTSNAGAVAGGGAVPTTLANGSVNQLMSPPNFALLSPPGDEVKRRRERAARKAVGAELTRPAHVDMDADADADAEAEPDAVTAVTAKYAAQELQQELSEAVAARKDADNRIIALENLVKTLRLNSNATSNIHHHHPSMSEAYIANGSGVGSRGFAGVAATTHITVQQQQQQQQQLPPQQQQQQSHHHHHHHKHHKMTHTITSSNVSANLAQSPPKLSVAGPITDL